MYFIEYLPRLNSLSLKLDYKGTPQDLRGVSIRDRKLVIATISDTYLVNIPIQITAPDDIKITSIKESAGILALGLKVSSTSEAPNTSFMELMDSSLQKWSVKDLLQKTPKDSTNANVFSFECLNCEKSIVDSSKYSKFLDMPSELWYEMMDFWHCHKPHNHTDTKKNYNGALRPSPTEAIIGSSYILIAGNEALKVHGDVVACRNCEGCLGENIDNQIKVYKWNLKLTFGGTSETFPSFLYLYYTILEKINSLATRKFYIQKKGSKDGVFVWVINIGLNIATENYTLINSLKLLYDTQYAPIEGKVEDDNTEELVVSADLFDDAMDHLRRINADLPKRNRSVEMKEDGNTRTYNISYLSR